MSRLHDSFYTRTNVVKIARELLGKKLISEIDGVRTAGIIVETEAYSYRERGCHAFNNKLTNRNKVMFESGGVAYVYLCYGIHHLFNVVTNKTGVAEAVLVRAVEPIEGEKWMMERMNTRTLKRITSGPGKLTKALGIDRTYNGIKLDNNQIWIEKGTRIPEKKIEISVRIGIDYAGEDALLPWRFFVKDNEWVSR